MPSFIIFYRSSFIYYTKKIRIPNLASARPKISRTKVSNSLEAKKIINFLNLLSLIKLYKSFYIKDY